MKHLNGMAAFSVLGCTSAWTMTVNTIPKLYVRTLLDTAGISMRRYTERGSKAFYDIGGATNANARVADKTFPLT